jgi:hypothetical protein
LVETSRAEYLAAFRRLSTCRHKTPSQTAKNLLFTAFSNQSPKMSALVELALCDGTRKFDAMLFKVPKPQVEMVDKEVSRARAS